MTIKDRFKRFIESQSLEIREFETIAGLANGAVNNAGHSLRESTLNKLKKSFPHLNTYWLITGKGNMLNTESTVEDNNYVTNETEYKTENMESLKSQLKDKETIINLMNKITMLEAMLNERNTSVNKPINTDNSKTGTI